MMRLREYTIQHQKVGGQIVTKKNINMTEIEINLDTGDVFYLTEVDGDIFDDLLAYCGGETFEADMYIKDLIEEYLGDDFEHFNQFNVTSCTTN